MVCLVLLSAVTITLSGIYSEHVVKARNVEFPQEELLCEAQCRKYKRHCAYPPTQCGPCVDKYHERDGICLPHLEARSNDPKGTGCPDIQCIIDCQFGHMRDEHNCELCQCLPSAPDKQLNPECPIPMCATKCDGGYAYNERGCMTCDCKVTEREITDEDIDTLIDEYRKLRLKNQEEIAKEKPILTAYNGLHRPAYPFDIESARGQGYPRGQGHHRYQTVRGQGHRGHHRGHQEHWDRGEGLLQPEYAEAQDIEQPEVINQEYGKNEGFDKDEDINKNEEENIHKEELEEQILPEEEHVIKESSPDGVRIEPVPPEVEGEDKPTHPTPAARQEYMDKLHPMQEVASMADIYFLDVLEPRAVDSNTNNTDMPQQSQQVAAEEPSNSYTLNDGVFIAVVAGCSVAGLVGLVVAGVCWYRLQKNVKAASEVEYPAYGITGPTKDTLGSPGDRKLAQSAQMYHYQHQKQQMIALEKANGEMKHDGSEDDSDEENEEGDYTVYECPGLAPTGEMEVKNPLFSEETPVTPTPDNGRDLK